MKCDGLLDDASAKAFDFASLRAAVAPASDYGERVFAHLAPFAPGEETPARDRAVTIATVARTMDAARLDACRGIFRGVPDAATAIARASMGDTLSDANFLELQRFFDACSRIDALLEPAALPACVNAAVLACARAIETGRTGRFGFFLADAFDAALASARADLDRAQAEYDAVRGRSAARVAKALDREISGPEFIVMRADLRGSLPVGVRVVRESPTYVLCELDADEATLAALERRDACASALAIQEEAVRGRLSHIVRAHASALDAAASQFGEIDVLVAAARFTQAHDCVPADVADRAVLAFEDGRFVPLAMELASGGRAFTPVSVHLEDVAVLTGPNMGGKSVCLRTCGLIAICTAYGLPVPARAATCGIFDEISWLGLGAEDDGGGLLSSFAREVVRLRDVLGRKRIRRFIVLDEFARTTTPREGRALLVAVIERLQFLGAVGMAATHLADVGEGSVRHFAVRGLRGIPEAPRASSLADALAALAASMDYTIEEVTGGTARRSDAIALASLLGLDENIVASAYRELREE